MVLSRHSLHPIVLNKENRREMTKLQRAAKRLAAQTQFRAIPESPVPCEYSAIINQRVSHSFSGGYIVRKREGSSESKADSLAEGISSWFELPSLNGIAGEARKDASGKEIQSYSIRCSSQKLI